MHLIFSVSLHQLRQSCRFKLKTELYACKMSKLQLLRRSPKLQLSVKLVIEQANCTVLNRPFGIGSYENLILFCLNRTGSNPYNLFENISRFKYNISSTGTGPTRTNPYRSRATRAARTEPARICSPQARNTQSSYFHMLHVIFPFSFFFLERMDYVLHSQ